MQNPCVECSFRNMVCMADQLFMDCEPWEEFESAMLEKLIDGTVLAVPSPKRKWRWFNDMVSGVTNRLGS